MYKLMHPKCKGISFYLTEKPVTGKVLHAHTVVFPDGTRPGPFDIALCGTCGAYAECIDDNLREVTDARELEMVLSYINILDADDGVYS